MALDRNSVYIGMNNFGYHSSTSIMRPGESNLTADPEIFIRERFSRKKGDPTPHLEAMAWIARQSRGEIRYISESSYFRRPIEHEADMSLRADYIERLKRAQLATFSSTLNPKVSFFPHHFCHASAAALFSPFKRSLIIVMDAAGSALGAFSKAHPELRRFPHEKGSHGNPVVETCTVYLQAGSQLNCVLKNWSRFRTVKRPGGGTRLVSDGAGLKYELAARYIFNSDFASGKVMGLAGYGRKHDLNLDELNSGTDWKGAFVGSGVKAWEKRGGVSRYADLALSVQRSFEDEFDILIRELHQKFPQIDSLILTGGCALNCTNNSRLMKTGPFKKIYIPPFPGDESIAFGASCARLNARKALYFKPFPADQQTAALGSRRSVATKKEIEKTFSGWKMDTSRDVLSKAAKMISQGKILAWFQGRSEVGPRALGQRSILAHPGKRGTRDFLNLKVKQRESFRPFGVTCTFDSASIYFDWPKSTDGPFMSFAPMVRDKYQSLLSEVTHVDGSSRIQTLRRSQNPKFHALIRELAKFTGVQCVLNTSLNIKGMPIAETLDDLLEIFKNSPIDGAVIEDVLVLK